MSEARKASPVALAAGAVLLVLIAGYLIDRWLSASRAAPASPIAPALAPAAPAPIPTPVPVEPPAALESSPIVEA